MSFPVIQRAFRGAEPGILMPAPDSFVCIELHRFRLSKRGGSYGDFMVFTHSVVLCCILLTFKGILGIA
jgi:hypothetical protein